MPQRTDEPAGQACCPFLGAADHPGRHVPMPCAANTCRVNPLGRRGWADLPLTCQADLCLSARYRTCRYWRA